MQRIQIRFYLLRQVQSSISSISIHKFYSKRALSGTVFPITNRSIHGLSSLVAGKIVHVISAQLTAQMEPQHLPPIGCTVQLLPRQSPANCGV